MTAEPIRIFIGTSANDEDLEFAAVLHYSLERHATQPLDITWMRLSRDPSSFWYSDPQARKGWNTRHWHTPFSALRWGIPEACNFQGKAIYLDIDMIAMADIAQLWNQKFLNNNVGMISKVPAICVTLYDCAKMKSMLPPIAVIRGDPGVYRQLRQRVIAKPGFIQRYQGNWNCLDLKRDGGGEYSSIMDPDIKILHFTQVATQPHLRYALPRLHKKGQKHWYELNNQGAVREHFRVDAISYFDRFLEDAVKAGYTLDRYRNPTPFGDYGRW